MQGKVALVTGAFTGIGNVTSLGLYCAGKHAAEELTKAAAHPMDLIAESEEMAEAVVFMASHRTGYMTGHPLAIDGGFGAA